MYYYKIKGDKVVKLEVEIDTEKLIKLRQDIIDNCSEIKHERYTTTQPINPVLFKDIKNFSKKIVGKINYNDFRSTVKDEYLVEYDKYYYPEIIQYIDNLLKGDLSMIEEINNIVIEDKPENEMLLNYKSQVKRCITFYVQEIMPLETVLQVQDFLKNCDDKNSTSDLSKKLILKGRKK